MTQVIVGPNYMYTYHIRNAPNWFMLYNFQDSCLLRPWHFQATHDSMMNTQLFNHFSIADIRQFASYRSAWVDLHRASVLNNPWSCLLSHTLRRRFNASNLLQGRVTLITKHQYSPIIRNQSTISMYIKVHQIIIYRVCKWSKPWSIKLRRICTN